MRSGIVVITLMVAAVLLIPTAVCTPGSDADDTEYGTGIYGSTYSFDTQQIDNAIKSITGRSISEWVDYFSDQSEY